jgi:hypothetical protein
MSRAFPVTSFAIHFPELISIQSVALFPTSGVSKRRGVLPQKKKPDFDDKYSRHNSFYLKLIICVARQSLNRDVKKI